MGGSLQRVSLEKDVYMEGRGDNPMTFGKKSSPFGISFGNPWRLSLPISQATKGSAMQCCFLKAPRRVVSSSYQISSDNPQKTIFTKLFID
jgi:hypothetical protein